MVKIRMWQTPKRMECLNERSAPSSSTGQVSPSSAAEIMAEIHKLVGLDSVKKFIKELRSFITIQQLRQKEKLVAEPVVLHMVFKGNPGTGKTTVARLLGRLFKQIGVLNKGHIIEVERADLVGEYIGHTAKRTRDQIKKALGGVLFIDEAYSLTGGGEKDFGKETIDALVLNMENHKNDLILILAGYQHEMDNFIETNPGLRSRFPIQITFPDYTTAELMDIAAIMLECRQYLLTSEATAYLRILIKNRVQQHCNSGNARMVRNLIERVMRLQAVRLVNRQLPVVERADLMLITKEDLVNTADDLAEN